MYNLIFFIYFILYFNFKCNNRDRDEHGKETANYFN